MRKILVLGVVLGMAVVFGGVTLVRADCAGHKSQAAADSATTVSKGVVTVPVDRAAAGQLEAAQADKEAMSAPKTKK